MSPAVNAAVGPVARRQIRLESLGPCHLHHWSHRALRELRGGPGGAAAGGVARETPKDTGKGRGLAGGGCGAGSTRWGQLQRKRFSRRGRRSWHRPALGTEQRRGELRLPPGWWGDRVPRGSRGDRSSQGTGTRTQPADQTQEDRAVSTAQLLTGWLPSPPRSCSPPSSATQPPTPPFILPTLNGFRRATEAQRCYRKSFSSRLASQTPLGSSTRPAPAALGGAGLCQLEAARSPVFSTPPQFPPGKRRITSPRSPFLTCSKLQGQQPLYKPHSSILFSPSDRLRALTARSSLQVHPDGSRRLKILFKLAKLFAIQHYLTAC